MFHCLTTRKTANSYAALFKYIEKNLMLLKPAEIMTDFEEGLRLGCKRSWPNFILRGCWFHLCRALIRKSNKLGMKKLIKSTPLAKFILKALMSLPLLPNDKLVEGYDIIKEFALKQNLPQFPVFFKYFEDYWLKKVNVCLILFNFLLLGLKYR